MQEILEAKEDISGENFCVYIGKPTFQFSTKIKRIFNIEWLAREEKKNWCDFLIVQQSVIAILASKI